MASTQAVIVAIIISLLVQCYAEPPVLQGERRADGTLYFEMHITLAKGGPDCHSRDIMLVNGLFQPTLELRSQDTVMINVFNKLPKNFPQVSSGISLHWHGFYMWNNATWYDGTAYVTQCPIQKGHNFTYTFLVDEAPGTYLWHDHSTPNRANGLQGALIVRSGVPEPWGPVDGEHLLFISDWFHDEGNVMAMQLNRPVVVDKVNPNTGEYKAVPSADALLINGKGFYGDCNMNALGQRGENGLTVPICKPEANDLAAPVSGGGGASKGCGHEVFAVAPGKSYYIRMVNVASATYVTVCFEGHSVAMWTADTIPVDSLDYNCIDLNSGQRYDVILVGSTDEAYAGRNFWISVHSQHRSMSPSTYAVLQYEGAPAGAWPLTPSPQPGVQPWSMDDTLMVATHQGVLGYLDNYDFEQFFKQFSHAGGSDYFGGVLYFDANKTILLNITAPVMTDTGMLRWAMSNVAMPGNPPCSALMADMQGRPNWLATKTINPSSEADIRAADKVAAARSTKVSTKSPASVYVNGDVAPVIPLIGMHVVSISNGDIVEIVINNRPGGEGSTDQDQSSGLNVQHPMHLHGHKFWIMGMGPGVFNRTRDDKYLNLYNPMLRDTVTLFSDSWAVLRFKADNPGIWPFHCHVVWHQFMGQQMYIIESQDRWPKKPKHFPKCHKSCTNNFGAFTRGYINRTYNVDGTNPYQLPNK